MAKDKKKDRDHAPSAKAPAKPEATAGKGAGGRKKDAGKGAIATAEAAGGQHHAATAHGRPTKVDTSLPGTRDELMALHGAARARRNAAALGGEAFRAAVDEIARIEVRIAAIDRAADPPLG
jgi:hypothetical protein